MKRKICILLIIASFTVSSLMSATAWAFPVFFEGEPEVARVPVIMYHLITEEGKYLGKFGVTPGEVENDLKYLKENGYETVTIEDLTDFVYGKGKLPEKPVVLTFDDGMSSDYYYLYPLLQKYDMKAVLSIVGKFTDDCTNDPHDYKKPYLLWEQIEEMAKTDFVEFQNHSYDLHGSYGSGKKTSESDEVYRQRLKADLGKLQDLLEEKIGSKPTCFTYPLGIISKPSKEALVEMGFLSTLSCTEGINTLKQYDYEGLFQLKRNNRRHGQPVSELLRKMEATP